jgi:tight adherence protein C
MSPQIIAIFVIIVAGISLLGGLVFVGLRENTGYDPVQARLAELAEKEAQMNSLEDIELQVSFQERVIIPMFRTLAKMLASMTPEQQIEQTRHQLELAGKAQTTDPRTFFGTRIMLTAVLGVAGFFVFFFFAKSMGIVMKIGLTAAFTALGFYLPVLQLQSQIKRRQDGILKALPDALDLMTICVEAGLSFDQAMGKVYEKWESDLAMAFGRVLQEIQLGKLRRDALRDMSNRMEVPDMTSFTAAIIQADQLGVSIAKILRIQSDQMRVKRRQRAQEKAQQAPVKMMLPMVLLIFPSIWIVLLGPSIIILMHTNVAM